MNVVNRQGMIGLIDGAKRADPEVVRWINDTVFPAVGLKTDETLPALVITDNAEKDENASENEETIVLTPDAISTAPAPMDLHSFNNSEFGELSIMMIEGKPYFPATECAKALGYSNPYKAIGDHCPHVTKREVGVQTGKKADGTPAMQTVSKSYIPEGDLYRLIAHSKLPSALEFEHWVFDEVLPSINKHGAYIMGQETMTETELIAKALIACNRIAEEAKAQLKQARVELKQKEEEVASLPETNKLHIRINELFQCISYKRRKRYFLLISLP